MTAVRLEQLSGSGSVGDLLTCEDELTETKRFSSRLQHLSLSTITNLKPTRWMQTVAQSF